MRVSPANCCAFVSDNFSSDNIGRATSLQRRRAVVPQAMKAKSATLPPSIATGTFLFIFPRFDNSSAGHESVKFVRKPEFFSRTQLKSSREQRGVEPIIFCDLKKISVQGIGDRDHHFAPSFLAGKA